VSLLSCTRKRSNSLRNFSLKIRVCSFVAMSRAFSTMIRSSTAQVRVCKACSTSLRSAFVTNSWSSKPTKKKARSALSQDLIGTTAESHSDSKMQVKLRRNWTLWTWQVMRCSSSDETRRINQFI
jgi:trehalose-6-phosphate synthase